MPKGINNRHYVLGDSQINVRKSKHSLSNVTFAMFREKNAVLAKIKFIDHNKSGLSPGALLTDE